MRNRTLYLSLTPTEYAELKAIAAKRYGTSQGAAKSYVEDMVRESLEWFRPVPRDRSWVIARLEHIRKYVERLGGVIVLKDPILSHEIVKVPASDATDPD